MSETIYGRLITKAFTGAATIPPSADHANGDWISTDIYEHELYIDDATGKLYTNINGVITELNPTAIDTNLANTDLTQTGNRTYNLNGYGLTLSGTTNGMYVLTSSTIYSLYGRNAGRGIGVLGVANAQAGVRGESNLGAGVSGQSASSYGGSFNGDSGILAIGTTYGGVLIGGTAGAYMYSNGNGYGAIPYEQAGSAGAMNCQGKALFNGTAATGSALVQVDSTTQGVLLPRMTTVQRDAIATPATGLEIYNTTTNRKEFYNGSYWRGDTFEMNVISSQYSPTASKTNYFGNLVQAPTATSAIRKMYIRKDGVIRFAEIYSRAGTAGSGENWSLYIRLNDTTDYQIQTVGVSAQERIWTNSAMNIPVVAGDYIEIKMINPAWVTAPTNIAFGGVITIE